MIRSLITGFARLASKIFSLKFYENIKRAKSWAYSAWLSNNFKFCGTLFFVDYPSFIRGGEYIHIGNNFAAGYNLRIECWDKSNNQHFNPILDISNNVICNNNVHIGCINEIRIGNNVLIGSNVLITDHQHGYIDERDKSVSPAKRDLYSTGPVIIEDDVWIGENVAILPNVVVGKGSIIGANSVVTKSIPRFSVVGGIPAKVLKML